MEVLAEPSVPSDVGAPVTGPGRTSGLCWKPGLLPPQTRQLRYRQPLSEALQKFMDLVWLLKVGIKCLRWEKPDVPSASREQNRGLGALLAEAGIRITLGWFAPGWR